MDPIRLAHAGVGRLVAVLFFVRLRVRSGLPAATVVGFSAGTVAW
jgi:hypothetical protein